jgi:pimeloyl-ACP methyl ester carboxylesterase
MRVANTLLAHYPDRLAHLCLIDAPSLFAGSLFSEQLFLMPFFSITNSKIGSWRIVRPLIDEVTASKISFVSSNTAESFWAG